MIPIETADDPRLRGYRSLADPSALADAGLFVAEGRLVVARLLALAASSGRWHGTVESVLLSEAAAAALAGLLTPDPEAPVYVVPQPVMNTVAGFNIHRGCLALARRPVTPRLGDAELAGTRTLVVLEHVNNPDNVGGIFRSGAALGADLVVLGRGSADPLYRKTVRTSMGASLVLPYATADPWTDALARIRRAGHLLAALTPSPDAQPLPDWSPGSRAVALIAGAEGDGLRPDTVAAADVRLRVPMTGRISSLNVHTAVAIALYHVQVRRHP